MRRILEMQGRLMTKDDISRQLNLSVGFMRDLSSGYLDPSLTLKLRELDLEYPETSSAVAVQIEAWFFSNNQMPALATGPCGKRF